MSSPPQPANPTSGPCLIHDPAEKAKRVADNVILQYDEIEQQVAQSRSVLTITPDLLRHLQGIAISGIYPCAGHFRTGPIYIHGTGHQPPPGGDVPALVNDMCQYVNAATNATAIHVASYLLWRLNWIHPFAGGNGRTSRAISHLALCVRLGFMVPGRPSIPEQIETDRNPYYGALDDADTAWAGGQIDVSGLEQLMSGMLAKQLYAVYKAAGGVPPPAPTPPTP